MIRRILALVAALTLTLPSPAAAYGVYGHEAIARIAMLNVAPATRSRALALLRQARLLETPTCAAATAEDASTWPDCIRSMGARFNYTSPWHYQNVDICQPFDLKSACADGNCVSAQVDRQVELLKNRTIPTREKVAALAFLIHFVGDLHMPLHAGDRGDRGGNDIKASYGAYSTDWLNLHSIWDTPLAERAITTPPEPVRVYSANERAALGSGTTEDWSREAWATSRDVAYTQALGGDPCGPKPTGRIEYTNAAIEASIDAEKQQVVRAGLRLARLLDEALDPANAFTPKPRRR